MLLVGSTVQIDHGVVIGPKGDCGEFDHSFVDVEGEIGGRGMVGADGGGAGVGGWVEDEALLGR